MKFWRWINNSVILQVLKEELLSQLRNYQFNSSYQQSNFIVLEFVYSSHHNWIVDWQFMI